MVCRTRHGSMRRVPRPPRVLGEPAGFPSGGAGALAGILADHHTIRRWRALSRASLGQRIRCALRVGVLWVV